MILVGEDEVLKIPEPNDVCDFLDTEKGYFNSCIVNQYGRFRYVFDDEETAKKVISNELLEMIYPYMNILNEEEQKEWENFIEEQTSKGSLFPDE